MGIAEGGIMKAGFADGANQQMFTLLTCYMNKWHTGIRRNRRKHISHSRQCKYHHICDLFLGLCMAIHHFR